MGDMTEIGNHQPADQPTQPTSQPRRTMNNPTTTTIVLLVLLLIAIANLILNVIMLTR